MGVLDGRVALVTGASGGIGSAICKLLGENGADVVIHYLNDRNGAQKVGNALEKLGRQAEIIKANVGIAVEARSLVNKAVERFKRIDILVNNAGVFPRSWALEIEEQEWDKVIDTNLKSTFMCSQTAARFMKKTGGGRIVNISSIAIRGIPRGAHYSATKAGIISLTRTLALEWAPDVLVNCVAPGLIDTQQPRMGMTEQQISERASKFPIPRLGRPEDIAAAVMFLVSDGSSWITGQTLHVNGGDMMF